MRGRKPTPSALRILRGNPRKHALNADEPTPGALDLTPPRGLSTPGRAEWRRVAPMLARLGILTETDAAALRAYCEAFATWQEATAGIRAAGMVEQTEFGLRASPYVKIANEAATQMRALLVEFGMTPSARARIHTKKPTETPVSKWGGKL